MFAIESNFQKKILFFVKTLKNNFSDPQTTNLIHILYTQKGVYIIFEYKTNFDC